MPGKNYFLAIAIDKYEHFSALNNAVKDVDEIIDVLTNLYQFEKDCIYRLYDQDATEDGMDEKFLELVDLVTEQDNLLIFYSGHGYYRDNVREGYWIPVNGRKDKISDYITNANLIRYLQNIKAHHLFVVVDSCFSGALVEQLRGETDSELLPSRRVFASGRTELVSDGLPGQNSPFAQGILNFLKANELKSIGVTSLISFVQTHVKQLTSQVPVEGRIRDVRDNRGEFLLKRKLKEEEFWTNTLIENSLDGYQKYLKIYPEGQFSPLAYEHLRKKVADKGWQKATQGNTQDDYESFIIVHPESDFVPQARAKLEWLKKAEQDRRDTEQERTIRLSEQMKEEEELERCRLKYKQLALDAKKEMKQGQYRLARQKLWQCEEYYRQNKEGFVPIIDEIRRSRETCSKHLFYEEYAEDGRRAFKIRDYHTASQLFEKALQYGPGPQNEELIRLRNAANSLLGDGVKYVNIPKSQESKLKAKSRGIENDTQAEPPPRKKSLIVVKKTLTQSKKQVVIPRVYAHPLSDTSILPKRSKDLTFLWIFLLIIFYFFLLYLLNII